MKETGIVRRIDSLGRIVLPKELRRTMDINEKDPLEIHVDGKEIVLRKHVEQLSCPYCGASEELIVDGSNAICPDCLDAFISRLEG